MYGLCCYDALIRAQTLLQGILFFMHALTRLTACSVVFQATCLITASRGPDNFLWLYGNYPHFCDAGDICKPATKCDGILHDHSQKPVMYVCYIQALAINNTHK